MYDLNEWFLFGLVLLLFYVCAEIGFRLGRTAGKKLPADAYPHISTIEGALLGLLALLLGFAFSMAMSRYDSRREIVVAEANDLQTTYLRSKFLPAPYRERMALLLRDYVDSRILYLQAGRDQERSQKALATTVSLQDQLWNQTVSLVKENAEPVRTGYFVQSLNGVIDDHSKRINAMESHVPDVILFLLIFVAAMTLSITGYSSGVNAHRLVLARSILIVLVAATLLVIIDLDRPRRGFITVSERSMMDLRNQIYTELSAPSTPPT